MTVPATTLVDTRPPRPRVKEHPARARSSARCRAPIDIEVGVDLAPAGQARARLAHRRRRAARGGRAAAGGEHADAALGRQGRRQAGAAGDLPRAGDRARPRGQRGITPRRGAARARRVARQRGRHRPHDRGRDAAAPGHRRPEGRRSTSTRAAARTGGRCGAPARARPVAKGREGAREPVDLTAPSGDSGLYVLEVAVGTQTSAVPMLVQSRERARMLVVVPTITWIGTDDGRRGPRRRAQHARRPARRCSWPRVMPSTACRPTCSRTSRRCSSTSTARTSATTSRATSTSRCRASPRASDRTGVLLAGSERWITRGYARRLRHYVLDGGRLASFGTESLRRGVTLRRQRRRHRRPPHCGRRSRRSRTRSARASSRCAAPTTPVTLDADRRRPGVRAAGGPRTARSTGFSVLEESDPPAERPRHAPGRARRRDRARGGGRSTLPDELPGAARPGARGDRDRQGRVHPRRPARVVVQPRRPPGRPDHAQHRRPPAPARAEDPLRSPPSR